MGQSQRQIRLDVPANLNATYANAAIIAQTMSEIIFDFVQVTPTDPRARVQSRIVMTPLNAKLLMKALEQNLAKYEEKHGEIKLPAQPQSLADMLFGGVRGDEDAPAEDTEPNG